ncbi:MAG TPA: hypothetical protein VHV31_01050 [Nitrolancea sp.]|jgi:hypothetical protein|nr:hypothetical protein [Nitrolancea sp.]
MVYREQPADRTSGFDQDVPPRANQGTGQQQSGTQQAQQAADAAKAKGQEMMDRAQQQAEAQRRMTADRLGDVADTVRQKQDQLPGGETTQRMAATAADKMDQASDYLQRHDMGDIANDLQQFARAHPTESLVAAVALGFLFGRALRH